MLKAVIAASVVALHVSAFAQSSPSGKSPDHVIASLNWLQLGSIGRVGDKGEFKVTGAYAFLGAGNTDKFLQANDNPPHGGHSYTIASTKAK